MIDEQELNQELNQEQPEVTEEHQESSPVQEPVVQQDSKHFKNLREKAQRMERERDELMRMLAEERNKKSERIEEDFSFTIGDDEIVEGKHIAKVKKQVKSEISRMQEELNAIKRQSSLLAAENKARSKYPDLDKVLSPENIEMLKDIDPDAAHSIAQISDPYAQYSYAYLTVKERVLNQQQSYVPEREKIQAQRNLQKPKAAASLNPQQGSNPLEQANLFGQGLTPELRKKLREEMDMYARRV